MANSDVLVRMKADTQNYDANIAKARRQLDQFKNDNLSLGGVMKQSTSQLVGMAAQFASVTAAIQVVGAALKKNEELMDEWGRTTEAASAIFDSFVNSLNTGDFSGFFQNIQNVINAARDAYDALDELGTFNAFNQINVQKAQTGFIESISNFREGTGSKSDVKAAANQLKDELGTRMQKENEAYVAAIKQLAESRKVDADMLMKALSGTYGSYEELKNTPLTGRKEEIVGANQFSRGTVKVTEFAATEQERLGQMLKKLSDDELNNIQALGVQAERTATEIAQIDKQVARVLSRKDIKTTTTPKAKKATGSGYHVGNYLEMPAEGTLADLQRQASVVEASMGGATTNEEYAEMEAHLQTIIDKMNEIKGVKEVTFTPGSLNDLNNQLKEAQAELANMSPEAEGWADALENVREKMAAVAALQDKINGSSATNEVATDMKGLADNVQGAISAFGQLGGAIQQIEDPSAKIAGIIMGAVAEVAASFAASLKGNFTTWDWIAAAIAGTATMISTISAIKSVTSAKGYAEGGMVGGNSYSGDNIVARLNSGEGVLTAQGVENAAALASANPFGNLQLTTRLNGTELLILLNNTNRSMGGSRSFYTERH